MKIVAQVLAIARLVRLADNQEPPENPGERLAYRNDEWREGYRRGYKEAVEDMLKAGFRKVEAGFRKE